MKINNIMKMLKYESCNEEKCQSISNNGYNLSLLPTYKLEIVASESYALHIDLDEKLNILNSQERLLSYVHATLLSDVSSVNDFRNHDMRFKIGTIKSVKNDAPLYTSIMPEDGSPPILLDTDLNPTFNSKTKCDSSQLQCVRHTFKRLIFMKSSTPVMVSLGFGKQYDDYDIKSVLPYAELSLHIDMKEFERFKQYEMSLDDITNWLSSVIDETILISDTIKSEWAPNL